MRILSLPFVLILASASLLVGETISVQPSTLNVGEGQTFSLIVDIANLTALDAVQFGLGFDPTILSAVSVTEGSLLPSGGATFFLPGTIDNVGGTITSNADTLVGPVPGVSGSGTVASFTFDAIAGGTTAISLSNITLLDSNLNSIEFGSIDGTVTVQSSAVPEPSGLPLIGVALLSLAGSRLWRRGDHRV